MNFTTDVNILVKFLLEIYKKISCNNMNITLFEVFTFIKFINNFLRDYIFAFRRFINLLNNTILD